MAALFETTRTGLYSFVGLTIFLCFMFVGSTPSVGVDKDSTLFNTDPKTAVARSNNENNLGNVNNKNNNNNNNNNNRNEKKSIATSTSSSSAPISIPGGATDEHGRQFLSVSVPILPVRSSDQLWDHPAGVTTVFLDVGAHEKSMYTRDKLIAEPTLAVIAIEPMYDKWGALTTGNRRHKALRERLFTVPAAVSSRRGFAEFRRAATDMCSSLLKIDPNSKRKDWPGGCTETAYTSMVPTVRLDDIISKIPDSLRIDLLKIDAQGADFDVVKSAGVEIKRVARVFAEVQVKKPLYADATNKDEMIEYMKEKGFVLVSDEPQNREKTEENLFFVNPKMGLDPRTVDIPAEPGRPAPRRRRELIDSARTPTGESQY